MRADVRLAALVAVAICGCIDPGTSYGVSCGSLAPNVTLRAVDAATAMPVPFSVTVNGEPPQAGCIATVDGGSAGPDCRGDLVFTLFDAATIVVSSDGYGPATLHIDAGRVGTVCAAPQYSFDLWVPLTPQ